MAPLPEMIPKTASNRGTSRLNCFRGMPLRLRLNGRLDTQPLSLVSAGSLRGFCATAVFTQAGSRQRRVAPVGLTRGRRLAGPNSGRQMRNIAAFAVQSLVVLTLTLGCQRSSGRDAKQDASAPQSSPQAQSEDAALPETETQTNSLTPVVVKPDEASNETVQPQTSSSSHGQQLYARHCAACHGERGDGKGLAASWLFPKPRDFRAGRFRLVSTDNNVPTRSDLRTVIERGMPGSAMPPWPHLSPEDREALIDEIMRLRIEGAREAYISYLRNEEELSDEEIAAEEVQAEIQEIVNEATTPGNTTEAAEIGDATNESVAHGRVVYEKFGCISCHGETGRGDGVQMMFDEEKMPTSPRDFTLGIFKGDPAPASLFRRIAYGMPGTPMPGSSAMSPAETVDLIHYILSLSSETQRKAALLQRQKILASRVVEIPDVDEVDGWAKVNAIKLRLVPLWWRSNSTPEVEVQAVHDGKTVAMRIVWSDDTFDRDAVRSDAFEDAAAMQLYVGPAEPFLGMGDRTAPVDVWYWDADRQAPSGTVESTYPNTVTDVFPFSESAVTTAELDRDGARSDDQPEISLPARASGNQIVPPGREAGGSTLQGGGPGSIAFRMPQNQNVWAYGEWKDGRWSVLMKRPLASASPEGGVDLQPGQTASVAFALWDGANKDRNGQKSITIWQDLELQK